MVARHPPVMLDWQSLFPPGARVLALPSWQRPQLLVPVHRFSSRWRSSSFYPALRRRALLYKVLLRARAATRLAEIRTVTTSDWPLGDFIQEVLPRASVGAVRVRLGGPVPRMMVQLYDKKDEVAGYLKYGEREATRRRLRREFAVLSKLKEVAPEPLKHGALGTGEAVLVTSLAGQVLPASLTPARGVDEFLRALTVLPPVSLENHPWVQSIQSCSEYGLDPLLEGLVERKWPVVVQHGDLTPWNMLRRADGTLGAVDWEYGTLESFPYLDIAYHVLQTSALYYRWTPQRAIELGVEYLTSQPWPALSAREARTLTRLAAYDAYMKGQEDGKTDRLQDWRRAVWEDKR